MSLCEEEVFAMPRRHGKPEREAQRAILKYLRICGCLVAVTDAGAAYRAGSFGADTVPVGWPDITGLLPDGRFIGLEVKSSTGRQSPAQRQMEEAICKRNGIYILARSIDDVEKALSNDR